MRQGIWLIGWKRLPASGRVTVGVMTYASPAEPMTGPAGCPADCGDLPRSPLESLHISLICKTGCTERASAQSRGVPRFQCKPGQCSGACVFQCRCHGLRTCTANSAARISLSGSVIGAGDIGLDGGGPICLLVVISAGLQVSSCHPGWVPRARACPWNSSHP